MTRITRMTKIMRSSGKIREEKVFDDILEKKKAFLDYKKWKVKTVENWDFSKGVSPWFRSKM